MWPLVFTALVIASASQQHVPYVPSQISYSSADVNFDLKVNAVDVQMVANSVMGLAVAENNYTSPDVNRDGSVDALDVQLTVNCVLGLYDPPSITVWIDQAPPYQVGETITLNAIGGGGNWDLTDLGINFCWFLPDTVTGPIWGTDNIPWPLTIPGQGTVYFALIHPTGLRAWVAFNIEVLPSP